MSEWATGKARAWQCAIKSTGMPPAQDALDSLIDSYCDALLQLQALRDECTEHVKVCGMIGAEGCCVEGQISYEKVAASDSSVELMACKLCGSAGDCGCIPPLVADAEEATKCIRCRTGDDAFPHTCSFPR